MLAASRSVSSAATRPARPLSPLARHRASLQSALAPTPSTLGQAIHTVAALDGTHRQNVSPEDPRVAMLLGWPAYVVDCVRVRFDRRLHGAPTSDALRELIAQLIENENLLGPVTETFG